MHCTYVKKNLAHSHSDLTLSTDNLATILQENF